MNRRVTVTRIGRGEDPLFRETPMRGIAYAAPLAAVLWALIIAAIFSTIG